MSQVKYSIALEQCCSKIDDCPVYKHKHETEAPYVPWCQYYSWDGKHYPSRPEYFIGPKLENMYKILGDGSPEELKELQDKCWRLAENVTSVLAEYTSINMPMTIYNEIKCLKDYYTKGNVDFHDWLLLHAELRLNIIKLIKVTDLKDKADEEMRLKKEKEASKKKLVTEFTY